MRRHTLRYDVLLLLTAAIWGFAFVAQRAGMKHVGPFTFNALRFALGALVLLPLAWAHRPRAAAARRRLLAGGSLAGLVLFAGAAFQQGGLVYTTAGKAGFITGLYVVFVPLGGLFWGLRPGRGGWGGAALAVGGLFLLTYTRGTPIQLGDALVLGGALCWAAHVGLIARLSPTLPAIPLAAMQFLVCAGLSGAVALVGESFSAAAFGHVVIPLAYAGIISVGIAYTLQVVSQRHAPPAHAAIIMSLEAVFAALGGWLLLNERLAPRALLGCALMLAGMVVSQLTTRDRPTPPAVAGQGAGVLDSSAPGGSR